MKKLSFFIKSRSLKLARHFENINHTNETSFFGLGQFVLLLAIAPFIFNLKLYSIGEIKKVPSLYEYDVNRFESLPAYPALGNAPKPPAKPRTLTTQEKHFLQNCEKFAGLFFAAKPCNALKNKKAVYKRQQARYTKSYKQYRVKQKQYQALVAQQKNAESAYNKFRPELSSKPETLPPIEIKQYSSQSFTAALGSGIALNAWQDYGTLIWLLGALLIIPALWLSVRKKCWGLLLCGLAVPAFNYLLSLLALVPNWNTLSSWQFNSSLFAQVAFLWFVIRGHVVSRSFAMYILALSISVSWAAIQGGESYSIFKAQLPIVVFVLAAIIARLVVKGVQENAYLFIAKGLLNNFRKAAHAFLLWLPLAFLALPLLYLTSVIIPKSVVNQLHADKVLLFNYQHDVLDNALQSVATRTDDAIFAWHLSTENTKRDIYTQGKKLLNDDLKRRVEVTFDQVMPNQLEFDEYHSDKAIIGGGIELAVDAAQDSTNDAFKKLRNRMKIQLGKVAAEYEAQFKKAVKTNTAKALEIVDDLHQKGQDVLLEANRKAQNSLWWSFNYSRAAQMLTVLLFVFVCLKSYLYVFARVSFNRNSGTFVTLGNTSNTVENVKSQIKATGLHYLIEPDKEDTYFISRRFQCRGKAPNFSIPQAFHAPFARLLNGAYSMNKIVMQNGDDSVRCTATQGVEFFEWDLHEDEVVFFDFHNFVGMSESIKISTHISTRASSLLIGKMIYSQAKGPGKLILMAEGQAEITDSELGGGSLPPERIIAAQMNTRFHIDSEVDLVNIYLSSAYVRPAGGGQVIVDVDSQRGTRTGLGSFIKRFILPV